jgi:hypothetical protein
MTATYSHAGVSKLDGAFKVRYANDALRVKVLAKNGHTDIDMLEMKYPMSKEDAVAYLISIDFDNGKAEIRAALEAEVDKRSVPVTKEKVVKAKAVKAVPAKVEAKPKTVKAKLPAVEGPTGPLMPVATAKAVIKKKLTDAEALKAVGAALV